MFSSAIFICCSNLTCMFPSLVGKIGTFFPVSQLCGIVVETYSDKGTAKIKLYVGSQLNIIVNSYILIVVPRTHRPFCSKKPLCSSISSLCSSQQDFCWDFMCRTVLTVGILDSFYVTCNWKSINIIHYLELFFFFFFPHKWSCSACESNLVNMPLDTS